jgi:hypothetical protein
MPPPIRLYDSVKSSVCRGKDKFCGSQIGKLDTALAS